MVMSEAKKKILEVALDLFSVYGYEGTSVSQIADAVGIKKPSLYSHFVSKQEIFNTMLALVEEHYEKNSFFYRKDWSVEENSSRFAEMTVEDAVNAVREQMKFLLHDPDMKKIRRLLTIEQFRNEELSKLQEKRVYGDVLKYHAGMVRYLIGKGILKDGDAEIMALQYAAPISMAMYRVDRDPSCEAEAFATVEKHIRSFHELYGKKG